MVKYLGLEQFGLWGLFFAFLTPLTLSGLGFTQAAIKYITQYYQEKNYQMIEKYISTITLLNLVIGTILLIFFFTLGSNVFLMLFNVSPQNYEVVKYCLYIVGILVFMGMGSQMFLAVPVALQNYRLINIVTTTAQISGAIISITIVLFGGGIIGYMIGYFITEAFKYISFYIISKKLFPNISFKPKLIKETLGNSFSFGGLRIITEGGNIIILQAERYIIGIILNANAVGIFNIPYSLQYVGNATISSITNVLFPAFSAQSNDSIENKANMVTRTNWLIISLASCVIMPLIPLAHSILKLYININIANSAYTILQFYMISVIISCGAIISNFFLLGNAKTKWLTYSTLLSSIVLALTSFYCIKNYGIKYAGIGTIAGMSVLFIFSIIYLKLFFKNSLSFGRIFTSILLPIILSITLALATNFTGMFVANTWLSLLLLYILLLLIAFAVILILSLILPYRKEKLDDIKFLFFDIFLKYFKGRFNLS